MSGGADELLKPGNRRSQAYLPNRSRYDRPIDREIRNFKQHSKAEEFFDITDMNMRDNLTLRTKEYLSEAFGVTQPAGGAFISNLHGNSPDNVMSAVTNKIQQLHNDKEDLLAAGTRRLSTGRGGLTSSNRRKLTSVNNQIGDLTNYRNKQASTATATEQAAEGIVSRIGKIFNKQNLEEATDYAKMHLGQTYDKAKDVAGNRKVQIGAAATVSATAAISGAMKILKKRALAKAALEINQAKPVVEVAASTGLLGKAQELTTKAKDLVAAHPDKAALGLAAGAGLAGGMIYANSRNNNRREY